MQAASHVPVAIRCERSYVFSMVGRESGDRIIFKINVVCRIVEYITNRSRENFSCLYISFLICILSIYFYLLSLSWNFITLKKLI